MTTTYLSTSGDRPVASADTLGAAQNYALTAEQEWDLHNDYRWDEYLPGQVWRLMSRRKGHKGRFSWTQRAVHAVEHVSA
ncbi:hypothetical protein ACFWFX_28715 [Streptomyces roseolus]|uniref:hypothetical protein n=1 Tax=Streptomyces roseolus TaxID=67358 RepID=UPI00364F397C